MFINIILTDTSNNVRPSGRHLSYQLLKQLMQEDCNFDSSQDNGEHCLNKTTNEEHCSHLIAGITEGQRKLFA